jgi:hypothetical protein
VGTGFSPLDERLQVLPPGWSPWVVEAIVRLGSWLPFEQVPEALAFCAGVTISRETARRLTETAGAALVAVEEAEVAALDRRLPPSPAGPPVQQVSIDGAMVPLVGGQWGEVKLLAIGTVQPPARADQSSTPHTTDLSYVARLTDADRFGRLATLETHRRGTETAGVVAAVMDGAVWQQGVIDLHRPDAVRILDFPHAAEHLLAPVQQVLGQGSAATMAWREVWVPALKDGDPAAALGALGDVPREQATDPAAATTTLRATLEYFASRWDQIQYRDFVARGLPIGSGCVESGHKVVMQARLKGPGMHWEAANVNPMLALRCAASNDRWAERWATATHRWRTTTTIRRGLRWAARHAPPPPPSAAPPRPIPVAAGPAGALPVLTAPPKTIVDGRPTAAHPWKRSTRLPRSGAPRPAKR